MSVVKKFFVKTSVSKFLGCRLIYAEENVVNTPKLEQIENLSISKLYDLCNETGDSQCFNEIFDRAYSSVKESEPTRQKIYRRLKK